VECLAPNGLNWAIKESNSAQTGRKRGFQELTVVLHSFKVQLLLINLITTPNWKVWP